MAQDLLTISEQRMREALVFIVDSNRDSLETLSAFVGHHHRVISVPSGENVIDLALQKRPDIILIDVVLDVSGIDVCKRIKQDELLQNIPIMFITNIDSQSQEQMCWDAGAVDFILKPANPSTLLNRLKVHITLKLQSDILRQLAYLDGLTGVFNRRYFDLQLTAATKQHLRGGADISLLMIDIDYFKLYNDNKGHLAGDDCLKSVAKAIKKASSRPLDIVCRYGGEEFAVILPETSLTGAKQVAERVMLVVSDLELPHPESPRNKVTISIGIACMNNSEAVSAADLVKRADAALYDAKEAGRNAMSIGLLATA